LVAVSLKIIICLFIFTICILLLTDVFLDQQQSSHKILTALYQRLTETDTVSRNNTIADRGRPRIIHISIEHLFEL